MYNKKAMVQMFPNLFKYIDLIFDYYDYYYYYLCSGNRYFSITDFGGNISNFGTA